MRRREEIIKTYIMIFISTVLYCIMFSCNRIEDTLEAVRAFNPEDKYFKANLTSVHFIRETSSTSRADSNFRQIQQYYGLPIDAKGCRDGIYRGSSPYDAYDYTHVVTVRIEDEKIIDIDYNEVHRNGKGKEEDEDYCEEMSVVGTTPALTYPNYEKQMLEKQDMMAVDGVSGATYSLFRFRYALTIALIKARLAAG